MVPGGLQHAKYAQPRGPNVAGATVHKARSLAYCSGAKLMVAPGWVGEEASTERGETGSMLARSRIFSTLTTMRCSDSCSPGLGWKGLGFGFRKAGQAA